MTNTIHENIAFIAVDFKGVSSIYKSGGIMKGGRAMTREDKISFEQLVTNYSLVVITDGRGNKKAVNPLWPREIKAVSNHEGPSDNDGNWSLLELVVDGKKFQIKSALNPRELEAQLSEPQGAAARQRAMQLADPKGVVEEAAP